MRATCTASTIRPGIISACGVQDLTLAEAALLVGMLPEPNNRDPLKKPTAAIESALAVHQLMVAEKTITVEQAAGPRDELKRRIKTGKLRRGNETLYAARISALSRSRA